MTRKYGEEQRQAVKEMRENFISELDKLYQEKFQQLTNAGLGDGFIVKITQQLLMSREGALTPLQEEIELN